MKKKVWVIVANASQATVYRAETTLHLIEVKSFTHPESHLSNRELVTDRPGRMTQKGVYGSDSFKEHTSPTVKEAMHFADELAAFLEEGLKKGEYEHLYLIVKPPFLGHIRQSLTEHVAKIVTSEIHKDLTHMKPGEIRDYLPPVL